MRLEFKRILNRSKWVINRRINKDSTVCRVINSFEGTATVYLTFAISRATKNIAAEFKGIHHIK